MQLVEYYSIYNDTIGNDHDPKTMYSVDMSCIDM